MKNEDFYIGLAILTALVLLSGVVYRRLKSSVITETLIAALAGFAIGPHGLNLLNAAEWGKVPKIVDIITSLCLGAGLMATALKIPFDFITENKRRLTLLVLVLMPLMFLVSSGLMFFVFRFDLPLAFLLGAIVTPTDPVISATIVSGHKAEEVISPGTRHALSFESGINDGLAFPLVILPLLFLQGKEAPIKDWLLRGILWETGGGIILGLAAGFIFGKVFEYAVKKKLTSEPAVFSFTISLSFMLIAVLELIHTNGILAVFVCGTVLNRLLQKHRETGLKKTQSMIERLFTLGVFVLFGMIAPVEKWLDLGWKAVLIVAFVMLFRRLPALLIIRKLFKGFPLKDMLFTGWFGPIGVAAIYYAFYCYRKIQIPEIWTITSLIVFSSLLIHGMTAFPFLKLYGKAQQDGPGLKA